MNEEYNNIGPSLAKQYKAALFIDNDERYVEKMHASCNRGMTIIKVDETPDLDITPHGSPNANLYADFIGRDNTYMKASQKLGEGDRIDPRAGIQAQHLPLIEKWINETAEQTPRAILFDWDRTISVIEGMYVDANGMHGLHRWMTAHRYNMRDLPDIYAEDALLYLCGGKERLAMIRGIMDACKQLNIDIIFITNNGSCNEELIGGLRELMDGLMPPGKTYEVICSMLSPFNGDKGKAFRESMRDRSSLVCLASFGGRRSRATIKRKKNKSRLVRKSKSRRASRKSYK